MYSVSISMKVVISSNMIVIIISIIIISSSSSSSSTIPPYDAGLTDGFEMRRATVDSSTPLITDLKMAVI